MKRTLPAILTPLVIFAALILNLHKNKTDACISTGNNTTCTRSNHFSGLDKVIIPDSIPSQIKKYTGFTLSFNIGNHTPNYSAWELLASETEGIAPRADKFWQDSEIDGCPMHSDYTRSGYDRGHIAPAADMKWSPDAMHDCFVMSNICPQASALNSGAWNTLEKKQRKWAQRDSAIYIVAGPVYEKSDMRRIGNTGIRIPSAFFKVIIAPYIENPRGIGFIFPNMSSPGNMQNYSMTIDEVEKITGFDFFSALPDQIENQIESKTSFKEWNKN